MTGTVFLFLLSFSLLLVCQYIRGRRQNLELLRWIDQEVRACFAPEDVTYVWLGGLIGVTLELRGSRGPERVVVVLLPRQSLLWYPISRFLTLQGDRVRVVKGKEARMFVGNLRKTREKERFRRWLRQGDQGAVRRSS
jgi:hypothetical protein